MNNFKKLNLTILCVLLFGSQVHSVDFEGSRLPPMEEFVRSISTKLHERIYKESIIKRKNDYIDRIASEKHKKKIAGFQQELNTFYNENYRKPPTASEQSYRIDKINDRNLTQHLTNDHPNFHNYSLSDQGKTVNDFHENRSKQLADIEERQILKRRIATKEYLSAQKEFTIAEGTFKKLYIEDKNKPVNIEIVKKAKEAEDQAAQNYEKLLNHVGTLVDHNFKPSTATTFFDIQKDIIDNKFNYQARLNQLHEKYRRSIKELTPDEKAIFLEMIIPSMKELSYRAKKALANNLTGTINR